MADKAVTATLIVKFGAGDNKFLQAEMDSVRNKDKSQFQKGDKVYFRVSHNIDYLVQATSGTVKRTATDEKENIAEADILSFVFESAAQTSKPISKLNSYSWFGSDLGAITKSGYNEVVCAKGGKDKFGIASVLYETIYDVWELTPPASMPENFQILILVAEKPAS